jgi:hypothetical protein
MYEGISISIYDAICAMIVVIAMPVANAKASAIPTNIFFTELPPFRKAPIYIAIEALSC